MRVGMRAEQDFAQTLAGEKTWLGALELYFFEFLAALALEFRLREGGFPGEFSHQIEERLGQFGQAGEGDGAGVRAGAGRKIGADDGARSSSIWRLARFVVPVRATVAVISARPGRAIDDGGVARAEEELAVEFRNGVRFGQNDFKTVRESASWYASAR